MVLFVNKVDMVLPGVFVNMVLFVNKIIMRSKSSLPMQLSCKLLSPFPILCFSSCPFYNSRVKRPKVNKLIVKSLILSGRKTNQDRFPAFFPIRTSSAFCFVASFIETTLINCVKDFSPRILDREELVSLL